MADDYYPNEEAQSLGYDKEYLESVKREREKRLREKGLLPPEEAPPLSPSSPWAGVSEANPQGDEPGESSPPPVQFPVKKDAGGTGS